jgi:hypothetical protein
MDNFVIGTIQENIKTLSHSLQLLSSDAPTKISDLSDVSSTTPADGDTLVYNATDDIFEPRAQSGGGTTGSLSSIVPIYLDTVNNRVGIGITTPQYALDVLGDIRLQSGGTDRLIFHNTTAGEDIVSVDAIVEGNGGIWGVRTKVNGSSLSEKIRIDNVGAIGIGGANYGTAGQVLTSNGPGSSVSWADVGVGSGTGAVALGLSAGAIGQEDYAVALGSYAGRNTQRKYAIALGLFAGNGNQARYSVAIGYYAGVIGQLESAVAIGRNAGRTNQGANSVAIGLEAGNSGQLESAVAIGRNAGKTNQARYSVAIGLEAGFSGQLESAVAIGRNAGKTNQGANSVAIGLEAGFSGQGANSVAIGYLANTNTNNYANTVVINGSGTELNPTSTDSTYIKTIREDNTANQVLYYDSDTGEVTRGSLPTSSSGGVAEPTATPADATNYLLVSKNTDGTVTEWLPPAAAAGGVPAPIITVSSDPEFILPNSNLFNYDFRNYIESGGNVIDDGGNVIAVIVGGVSSGTSFTSSEGLVTSTTDYLEITNPLPALGGTGHFSIEFYTKMEEPTATWHTYFSFRNAATDSYIQIVIRGDDAWFLEMYHNGTLRQASYRPFPVGEWDSTNFHHFVLTFSGGTTEKLYIDDNEVTKLGNAYSNSITYDSYESFQRLQIAGSQGYDSNIETTKYFRMYDGVLTSDQINNLYTNRDKIGVQTETGVTNYALVSKNAEGTETEWSNDFVDKTTNQYISGFKNFSNFMSIAIGSPTPQTEWPLRIGSSGPTTPGDLYFYASESMANEFGTFYGAYWGGNPAAVIGLYVDEGIRAARLYIMSDRRIKKDVVDIQDDEALNKLRVLQPKKYKYIDPNKGTQEVYGFIAQEVAEVIPYSVRLENSYLPSHMFFCKIINTNVNTSIIDTYVSHTLIVNDFLSFRDNKYNLIEGVKVIEIIDDKTIKVDRIFNKEDTVYTDTTTGETFNDVIYLYGKKIDDFHTLNKDTIWTVATAALQEVDRQLQAEKSKTSDLISRLESLEARVETLESK